MKLNPRRLFISKVDAWLERPESLHVSRIFVYCLTIELAKDNKEIRKNIRYLELRFRENYAKLSG